MAALQSTSTLARARSGRVPYGKPTPTCGGIERAIASGLSVSRTNISIFLANLRLLDLDMLPTWPGFTERTFTPRDASQGQKKRIQSVEWALFHLFCLWDPEETRNKLQALFPPVDQMQSVNLRAALLRALDQAKKNGALDRDTILRKTMLDECHGERLEEVLAVFSSAVLKRVIANQAQVSPSHLAVSKTLALENHGYSIDSVDRAQLHILILAHRASLFKTLRDKDTARANYKDFIGILDAKQRSMVIAGAAIGQDTRNHQQDADKDFEKRKLDLWNILRNNWSGNDQWLEVIFSGDCQSQDDVLFSRSFDHVWRRVRAGRLSELDGRGEAGLLEQLGRRVQAQAERMKRWEVMETIAFGKQQSTTMPSAQATLLSSKQTGFELGFLAHASIYPTSIPGPRNRAPILANGRHDDYVESLRQFQSELQQINRNVMASTFGASSSAKAGRTKIPVTVDDQKLALPEINDGTISEISDVEEALAPLLPLPILKPARGDENPSIVQKVQSPRVRLKKSLTFKVKLYDSDDEEHLAPAKLPQKDHNPAQNAHDLEKVHAGNIHTLAAQPAYLTSSTPPHEKSRKQASTVDHYVRIHDHNVPHVQAVVEEVSPPPSPTLELADRILTSMNNMSPSPVKKPRHTLSLAERTRLSMARSGRPTGVDADEDSEPELKTLTLKRSSGSFVNNRHRSTVGNTVSGVVEDSENDENENLHERTRKSLMRMAASKQKAGDGKGRRSQRRSKTASSTSSSAFSRKDGNHNTANPIVEEPDISVFITEELISGGQDDAEAIFRSRPKIKMSPAPSPSRANHESD